MRLEGSGKTPGLVTISPDKQIIAAGIYDETRIWHIDDGKLIAIMPTEPGSLVCLAFSPDSKLLARGCPDLTPDRHFVQLWNVSSQSRVRILDHRDTLDIAFSPDGTLLATVSLDALYLWQVSDGVRLRKLETPGYGAYIIAFNPDGSRIAVASWFDEHYELFLWSLDGEILWNAPISIHQIEGLSFSKDGEILSLVTRDGELQWRDSTNGSLLQSRQLPLLDVVRTAEFGLDGDLLAISYDERNLDDVFRTSDQTLVASFGPGKSNGLAFSQDAKLLATEHFYDIQICQLP
jgi:WD40 repeat protein